MPNDMTPLSAAPKAYPLDPVLVEVDQLRTLIRITTELRDPRWKLEPWIINLGQKCGLNLQAEVK